MNRFNISVELDINQVEKIVLQELKTLLDLELQPVPFEGVESIEVDMEMVQALITVIKGYLPIHEIHDFEQETAGRLQKI